MSDDLQGVLQEAWTHGFSTRSNIARDNAEAVAEAASRGYITTINPVTHEYTRGWHITPAGCERLFKRERFTRDEPILFQSDTDTRRTQCVEC